jgi:hypothetical protein
MALETNRIFDRLPIQKMEVRIMPITNDALLLLWDLENMPACDEGMELARRFLGAAGECVNTLGRGRTSSGRADLLWTYNAMVMHSDRCEKCNEV